MKIFEEYFLYQEKVAIVWEKFWWVKLDPQYQNENMQLPPKNIFSLCVYVYKCNDYSVKKNDFFG